MYTPRPRATIALFLTALILVGGADVGAASKRTAPPGYERTTVSKAGFSILLPDDWVIFKQTRKDLEAVLAANPQFGDIDALLDNARRTPLRAFYNVGADGVAEAALGVEFQAGVNALTTPSMAKAEIEAGGVFKNVEAERSEVAGKAAVRAQGDLTLTAPSGAQAPAHIVLYSVLTNRGVLSFGFTERVGTDHHETIETMIRSVRFLRTR